MVSFVKIFLSPLESLAEIENKEDALIFNEFHMGFRCGSFKLRGKKCIVIAATPTNVP